jgi:hypothetical protein
MAALRLSLFVHSTLCLRQTAVGRRRLVEWKMISIKTMGYAQSSICRRAI